MNKYITKEPYKGLVIELLQPKEEPKYIKEVKQEVKEPKVKIPKDYPVKKYLLETWKKQLKTNIIQTENLIKLQKLAIELQEPNELIVEIGSKIREKGINKNKL